MYGSRWIEVQFEWLACAGFGEQIGCWTSAACPDCAASALLVLRNLAFCTENHAHFLAAPKLLSTVTASLSASSSLAAITAAASCLWTLTYLSEKVRLSNDLYMTVPFCRLS